MNNSLLRKAIFSATALCAVFSLHAETFLMRETDVKLCAPLEMNVPEEAVRDADYAAGKLTVHIRVSSDHNNWTIYRQSKPPALKNSKETYPTLRKAKYGHFGYVGNKKTLSLDFPLPPARNPEDPLKFTIPLGISSWENPTPPFAVEIWTGIRLNASSHVDLMNRNCIVTVSDPGAPVRDYVFEFPSGKVVTKARTARKRLAPDAKPFTVKITANLEDGTVLKQEVSVVPHETPAVEPLPDGEILVGVCVYPAKAPKADPEKPDKFQLYLRSGAEETEALIREKAVGLLVTWFAPKVEHVAAAAKNGIRMMTIYQRTSAQQNNAYRKASDGLWMNNNIGEYAGYLYQPESSAKACGINTQGDLRECRDFFINRFINGAVRSYHSVYPYMFSTSGSTLAAYEMAGGIDYILCELYALGAQNLAWSSAEMRGAARKWKPEFWGGWLAAEWQSCHIPYTVDQKYSMLRAGLYQQYLMGSRVIVLESGSQSTQAGKHTAPPGPGLSRRDYNASEEPVKRYMAEMTEFQKFVKANPRAKGSPETRIAAVLGNCGSFVGLYVDWFCAFAQYEQGRKNKNWRYGDPELSDCAVQSIFFPRPKNLLGKYANQWLGGTPYGQCDVVNIDEEVRLDDISRYQLLIYSGWNTMTPEIMNTLRAYVENGGTVFLGLPHFSTRADREYRNFTVSDLVGGGDLSALLNVKVRTRELASGELNGKEFALSGTLKDEPVASIETAPEVETIASVGDRPLLVRQKIGKGAVYMLLTWEYPGKRSFAKHFKTILAQLGDRFAGPVRIRETSPGDNAAQCVAYAVYGDTIYLLNMDCMREREFILERDGTKETLKLGPAEFRTIR